MSSSDDQTTEVAGGCIVSNNDVLCGRGGEIHNHAGNRRYREWVQDRREAYSLTERKLKKIVYAREVVSLVKSLDPPGRFLTKNTSKGSSSQMNWTEITEERALDKTSQALREGAPEIRAKAKQKQEVLKKLYMLSQPRIIVQQPLFAAPTAAGLYHHYCGRNTTNNSPAKSNVSTIPANPTTDPMLLTRLANVEIMLERLLVVQNRRRMDRHLIKQSVFRISNDVPILPAASGFDAPNAVSPQEIDLLRREVLAIRQHASTTKKHALDEYGIQPNKKARVECDQVLSNGLLLPQKY